MGSGEWGAFHFGPLTHLVGVNPPWLPRTLIDLSGRDKPPVVAPNPGRSFQSQMLPMLGGLDDRRFPWIRVGGTKTAAPWGGDRQNIPRRDLDDRGGI